MENVPIYDAQAIGDVRAMGSVAQCGDESTVFKVRPDAFFPAVFSSLAPESPSSVSPASAMMFSGLNLAKIAIYLALFCPAFVRGKLTIHIPQCQDDVMLMVSFIRAC